MLNSKLAMKKRLLHKYRLEPASASASRGFYETKASPAPSAPVAVDSPALVTIDSPTQVSVYSPGTIDDVSAAPIAVEKYKEETIDVETVSDNTPSSTPPPSANNQHINSDNTLAEPTQVVSKPSLEQVIARCRLKSGEGMIEPSHSATRNCKSAIESLRDVVKNVTSASNPPAATELMSSASSRVDNNCSHSSKRYLTPHAKTILSEWFRKHLYRPYPTHEEKKDLAALCGISSSKVDTWFANKRNRTHNTRKFPPKYSQVLNYCCSE